MKAFKGSIRIIVFAVMLVSFFSFAAFFSSVTAIGTYEALTYTVDQGEVSVTSCRKDFEGELTVPETIEGHKVTKISYAAFSSCNKITSVKLPETLKTIGASAFAFCEKLEKIELPSSLETLGKSAFSDCSSLAEVVFNGENVTSLLSDTFKNCTSLDTLILPKSIKTVESGVLKNCSVEKVYISDLESWCETKFYDGLLSESDLYVDDQLVKELDIPNGVAKISSKAFYGCKSIESVRLPMSVREISESAFENCEELSVLSTQSLVDIREKAFCNTALKEIDLPESVESIGKYAFSSCDSLKSVILSGKTKNIAQFAFYNSPALEEITLNLNNSSSNTFIGYVFGADSYTEMSEFVPDSLSSVTLVGDMTYVSANAFYRCGNITSVMICEGVTSIKSSAFSMCRSLSSVALPSTLKVLDGAAFSYCETLSDIHLPERLETIGSYAFLDCVSLEKINIPDSVTKIENGTFKNCDALESVRFYSLDTKNKFLSVFGENVALECLCKDSVHSFSTENILSCSVCEFTQTAPHVCENELVFDTLIHYYKCKMCGAASDEETHIYDNSCDISCSVCSYERSIVHSYFSEYVSDSQNHWYQCTVCGYKKNVAVHIPGEGPTEASPQICIVCEHVIASAIGHTHDFSDVWQSNTVYHWHVCASCGEKQDNKNHIYENSCDNDCGICGYIRNTSHNYKSTWQKDSDKHWNTCSKCGDKTNIAVHSLNSDGICGICDYKKAGNSQDDDKNDKNENDNNENNNEDNNENNNENEDNTSTETPPSLDNENGSDDNSIPKDEDETQIPETDDDSTKENEKDEIYRYDGDKNTVLIVLIIVISLETFAVVALCLFKRRR